MKSMAFMAYERTEVFWQIAPKKLNKSIYLGMIDNLAAGATTRNC